MKGIAGIAARIVAIACALGGLVAVAEGAAWLANEHWALPLDADGRPDFAKFAVRNAREAGVDADTRRLGEVVQAAGGPAARVFPVLSVAYYLDASDGSRLEANGRRVLPLSLVPRATGYYCNESGAYVPFATDRHGFRNPDSAWDAPAPRSAVIVGDSMAMGACLPAEQSIAGVLRAGMPDLLNLSIGANGPLMELATLREYLSLARPRHVVWVYFQNDREDLRRDLANPILRRYLADPGFSQGLVQAWPAVVPPLEKLTADYLAAVVAAEDAQRALGRAAWQPDRSHLARRWRHWAKPQAEAPSEASLAELLAVVERARALAQAGGARFTVATLPDCSGREPLQDAVRHLAAAGIDVLDLSGVVAQAEAAGERAFSFCPGGHLTPAVSQRLASAIRKRLAQ